LRINLGQGGKFAVKQSINQQQDLHHPSAPAAVVAAVPNSSLANCDKELVERIEAEIIHKGHAVTFEDISGLDFAKKCVDELICWFRSFR
jgi:hypothetical protein